MAAIGRVRTGVDCSQDKGNAEACEAGHEDDSARGSLHFATNKLKKRHQSNSTKARKSPESYILRWVQSKRCSFTSPIPAKCHAHSATDVSPGRIIVAPPGLDEPPVSWIVPSGCR